MFVFFSKLIQDWVIGPTTNFWSVPVLVHIMRPEACGQQRWSDLSQTNSESQGHRVPGTFLHVWEEEDSIVVELNSSPL